MCSQESHIPDDRLSSLPDEIKSIILSFLPFKQVLQTSILSRPWLNLWTHSQVLHVHAPFPKVVTFHQVINREVITDGERKIYVEWVNRVLLGHKGQFLKEFKIVCHLDKLNQNDIDNWLVAAFAKKVQCLELNFYISALSMVNKSDNYVFPGPFLNCCGKSQFLQFDFKCLKSLSLQRVDINEEGINFFLVNCPFLEILAVVGNPSLANLVISDPTLVLKHLTIKHCRQLEELSISNLNFLVSLAISCSPDGNLTLTGLPMLVELFISGSRQRLSRSLIKVSACFSMLEALMLDGSYLKDVTQLLKYGGKLKKLKRLVICFGAVGDESLTNLISIVNSCPLLEEFVLMLLWLCPERTRTPIYKVEKSCKSTIKSKSLKVFEFGGYYGRFSDVELINLVKNAVGLETIIIDPRDGLYIQNDLLRPTRGEKEEQEDARRVALGQYESLRESVPPHVHLLLR